MTKAGSRQRRVNQPTTGAAKGSGGWWQDRLSIAVNDWWQKHPATKVLMVPQWFAMTKEGGSGGQQCNNQPTSSKTRAAAGVEITWGKWTTIDVKSNQEQECQWLHNGMLWQKREADNNATTNQQWEQQRRAVAGDKTAWGQWSTLGSKSSQQQEHWQ
jgi:hypothetical protein